MAFKKTQILNKSEYKVLQEFYRPIFAAKETITHPEIPCLCPNEGWKKFQFSITNNTSSTQLVDLFKNNNESITETFTPNTYSGRGFPIIGGGNETGNPVYNPRNKKIYTVGKNLNHIVVTDPVSLQVSENIELGNNSTFSVLNTLDNTIYVLQKFSDTVSVIDCDTNTHTATISVPTRPVFIAYNPTLNRVYITSQNDIVTVINCNTNAIITTIPVGDQPSGIAYASGVDRIYVLNAGDDNISVINPNTNTVVGGTITVGTVPIRIAYNTTLESIYVTNAFDGTVSVIDTNTNTVTTTITVGVACWGVLYNPTNEVMYVAATGAEDRVTIIGSDNTIIDNISICCQLTELGYNIDLNQVYVTNDSSPDGNDVNIIAGSVTFDNVDDYNYFVTQQFTDPFKVACIRIQSLTQEQLFSAFLVQFKDASGEVYTYPRFPFEKINTYQEQDTIVHLKFDKLVLDTTQSFVNYELLANETVTFILCYKPLLRSDFLKDNKDHYTKQVLDIEDRKKCYISWKQKHIDLQNKFYKGDLQNKSHYSFTIQNPSGSDVAIDLFDSVTQAGFTQRYPTLSIDDETSYNFFARSMRWSPYKVPLMEVISSSFEQTKQAVVVNLRYAGGDIYNRAYYPNLEIDPYQTITNRVTIPFMDLVFHTEIKFTSYIVLAGQTVSFVVFYERLKRADFFAKHYKTKTNISYGVENRTMGKCA